MLFSIYKRIQLFSFAFATSGIALISAAVMAGDISQDELEGSMAELSLDYFDGSPGGMSNRVVTYFSLRFGEPVASETQPPRNSLEALRARQG